MEKNLNVLFIVVDCFRADHFEGKGNARIPFLESLKKKSTIFSQAISTSSTTHSSLASILTGVYRPKHGVTTSVKDVLSPGIKTIAESFKEQGYYTIAEMWGALIKEIGICKGFDEYNLRQSNETIYGVWGNDLIKRLGEKSIKEPFFLLLHLGELHRPRFMTKEFNKSAFGKIAYERSLSCLDFYLEKMFKHIKKDTIIVLVADHAEKLPDTKAEEYLNHVLVIYYMLLRKLGLSRKFCERESHGTNLCEDVIRIPLLFKGKMFPKGKVVRQMVSQVDIFATIADALGLKAGKDSDGRSLMPLIQGKAFVERGIKLSVKKDWIEGIRTSKWQYVHGVFSTEIPEEVYNLVYDSEESDNLATKDKELLNKMRTEFNNLKNKIAPKENIEQNLNNKDSKLVEKELKKLGYM